MTLEQVCGRARSRAERDQENAVAGGWLEFGFHHELPRQEGGVTRCIVMVQDSVIAAFFWPFFAEWHPANASQRPNKKRTSQFVMQ